MDAVDAALVQFNGRSLKLLAYEQFPIDTALKGAVRRLDGSSPVSEVTRYDAMLGELFAEAVLRILEISGCPADQVTAIGSHGQTILHLPEEPYPRTMQIGDPNLIALRTGIPCVADFRRMDMAGGGQGAPLAPAFHEDLFRIDGTERAVLNIGGIANLTLLPGNPDQAVSGFDCGPGNGLLDEWNRRHRGTDMDVDGAWAAAGTADSELLEAMLADPYLNAAPPKSTGRDYFNLAWVEDMMARCNTRPVPGDIQATLLELSVHTMARAARDYCPEARSVFLCGGGVHNTRMVARLRELLPEITVADTGELGLNPDAVEAVAFAWLARQRINRAMGNQPSVTGADRPLVLGGLYQAG